MADTQGTVDKHLGLHAECTDLSNLFAIKLSGKHHAIKPGFGKHFRALIAVAGALGAGMKRDFGDGFLQGTGKSEVLDNESVRAHTGRVVGKRNSIVEFAVGHKGVERDIGFDPGESARADGSPRVLQCEIFRFFTCIERRKSEINFVGTGV